MKKKIVVAIDGPAASGKSTTARLVAKKLGYLYIDSGAMYRAVTLLALRKNIPTTDFDKVAQLAESAVIQFKMEGGELRTFLNGEDVSQEIRSPEVTKEISPVAANPRVREILVAKQREMGKEGGIVMDGRDITTVVFPDAELKIFMKASAEERARRRVKELAERGIQADFDQVLKEIIRRDEADSTRAHGPLTQAPDAVVIDTTNLSIEEQVERIYKLALEKVQDC
ncbi:MAG: (d)CMP kinase [Calditrichaeota bacterium]|nr:MAG: (d)CMP kinase [Calditrichota bacterium]